MLCKKTPLFIVACLLCSLGLDCYAQSQDGPLVLEESESHQEMLLNTAKGVANVMISDIRSFYGLPESGSREEVPNFSKEKREFLNSRLRESIGEKLSQKEAFTPLELDFEVKMKRFVIKNKKVGIKPRVIGHSIPSVGVYVFDCKESNYSSYANLTVDYNRTLREWELRTGTGDLNPEKTGKCFTPELLGSGRKYEKLEHGDHYHYVPKNRDSDIPIARFPTEPPKEGEYITPSGEIVEKEE